MISAGLILEGGGMRGIYTAGVLDFFLDKKLIFSHIYGVSAGSCHACSYLSGQRGRALRISTEYLKDKRYCGIYSLLTTGDLFGAKMCYDTIPNELDLYDYGTFDQYPGIFYAVVTNCRTGQAEYLPVTKMQQDIIAVRASSSLPLVSRMVTINGKQYLDGGIADAIPLAHSIQQGNQKNVVILTQSPGYQKKRSGALPLMKLKYLRHPALVTSMANRHLRYNETLTLIQQERRAGNAFVIQPKNAPAIGRNEKDPKKLRALYAQGYQDAAEQYEALKAFLGNNLQ